MIPNVANRPLEEGPIELGCKLVHGLHFRTLRAISWIVPGGEWVVPLGARGVVKVNGRELGFVFEGMSHPTYIIAPSIAKAGDWIHPWMEPLENQRSAF